MLYKLIKTPSLGFAGKLVICVGAGSKKDLKVCLGVHVGRLWT